MKYITVRNRFKNTNSPNNNNNNKIMGCLLPDPLSTIVSLTAVTQYIYIYILRIIMHVIPQQYQLGGCWWPGAYLEAGHLQPTSCPKLGLTHRECFNEMTPRRDAPALQSHLMHTADSCNGLILTVQWKLSVTTTSIIKSIAYDLFSNVF